MNHIYTADEIEELLVQSGMERMSKYFGRNHTGADGISYEHIIWNRKDQYYRVTEENDQITIRSGFQLENGYEDVKTFPASISPQEVNGIIEDAKYFYPSLRMKILKKYLTKVPDQPVFYKIPDQFTAEPGERVYRIDFGPAEPEGSRTPVPSGRNDSLGAGFEETEALLAEKKYKEALAKAKELAEQAGQSGQFIYQVYFMEQQSLAYYMLKDFQNALFTDQDILTMPVVYTEGMEDFLLDSLRNTARDLSALDAYEEALEYALKYVKNSLSLYGAEDEETADAAAYCVYLLIRTGDVQKAYRYARTAYSIYKSIYGPAGDKTLMSLWDIAALYSDTGLKEHALNTDLYVYRMFASEYGEDDERTLDSLVPVFYDLCICGLDRDAQAVGQYHMRKSAKVFGENSLKYLRAVYRFGTILLDSGMWGLSSGYFRDCIGLIGQTDAEHTELKFSAMMKLAEARRKMGHGEIADNILEDVYKQMCACYGEKDNRTLDVLEKTVLSKKDSDPVKTKKTLEMIYKEKKFTLGRTNIGTLRTLHRLANAYDRLKEYGKSLELNRYLYDTVKDKFGAFHDFTLVLEHNLILSYRDNGMTKEACNLAWEAYIRRRDHFGVNHPDTQTVRQMYLKLSQEVNTAGERQK